MTLAERFNGEIINADALQMYEGLPITTNKISIEERIGIPHHLLGCIGLEESTWTVGRFVREVGKIINEIRGRGKLPIVVGGTHYYTQSLLFKEHLLDAEMLSQPGEEELGYMTAEEQERKWPILAGTTAEMLAELEKVDCEMAQRWHPDDSRKIRRSLEIWLRTGKKASEIYHEQQLRKRDSVASHIIANSTEASEKPVNSHPILRYSALTFWVHAEPTVLKVRLDARVDRMIGSGLLEEVSAMRKLASQLQATPGTKVDFNKGIWIAIGYKQFAEYLSAVESGETDAKRLEGMKREAVERTQIATRQYSRSQCRWLRLKLLKEMRGADGVGYNNLYVLDGTDLTRFEEEVEGTACSLTESFLLDRVMPDPGNISQMAEKMLEQNVLDLEDRKTLEEYQTHERECSVCGTVLVNANDRKQHYGSSKHKCNVKRKKKAMQSEKESEAWVGDW